MIEITEFPIAPNKGQVNADKVLGTINDRVMAHMKTTGVLKDTDPKGRHFADNEHNLFGYNGVVVHDEQITSLVNLNGDERVPVVGLGTEVIIVGDSRGYVSSGHKPGERVKVIGFIEPFYSAGAPGLRSSDKIIQVQGGENGTIGWIKPSEFDKATLIAEKEKEIRQLFEQKGKK